MKEIEPKRSAASWLAELAKGRYGEPPRGWQSWQKGGTASTL